MNERCYFTDSYYIPACHEGFFSATGVSTLSRLERHLTLLLIAVNITSYYRSSYRHHTKLSWDCQSVVSLGGSGSGIQWVG